MMQYIVYCKRASSRWQFNFWPPLRTFTEVTPPPTNQLPDLTFILYFQVAAQILKSGLHEIPFRFPLPDSRYAPADNFVIPQTEYCIFFVANHRQLLMGAMAV